MDYLDETMPYKKKSKRRAPAKAKHKHDFQPCIFEYEGIQFDSAHGVIPKEKEMFGDYCVVCGKIGHRSDNRWMERVPTSIRGVFSFEYTEEAKKRTQPRHENPPYISSERHLDTEVCPD